MDPNDSLRAAALSGRIARMAFAIFAIAWLLRFFYLLELRDSPLFLTPMLDESYHVSWAREIASGDWIGSGVFFRAPLYPYLLALTFLLFKGSLFASRIFQITYGSLTPVVVYFLGRRLSGERGGRIAGVIAACYPFFIYFDSELLIVSLVVLLDLLMVLAVLRASDVPSWGRWIASGVIMGFSAVARPSVLVVAPFVFIWVWWSERRPAAARARAAGAPEARGRVAAAARAGVSAKAGRISSIRGRTPLETACLRFALFALGAAIVIFPVTLRNYAFSKDFVLIASQGGVNFFIGNNARSDGASAVVPSLGETWEYDDCERIAEREEGRHLKPREVSAYWYSLGRGFLRARPGAAARLYLKKLTFFWDRFELANNKDIYYFGRMSSVFRALSWLSFGVIAPLGLLGLLHSWRRRKEAGLLVFFILSYMAGVVAFFVCARFRLPVVPFLIVFASCGIVWVLDRAARRDLRSLATGAAFVAAAAVFVNVDFYGTHVGDRAQTHYTIGLAHANQGRYEDAIEEYRKAIGLSPNYAKAYNNLGLALEGVGLHEGAYEAYATAAEKDHSLASARNNLGALVWRKGDREEAARWFREALERDPWLKEAHYNLASVLLELGDIESAEHHFTQAVVSDRSFKEAWNALGMLFEDTGRLPESIGAYQRAVLVDPTYAEARNNLGVVLAKTGQLAEAISELESALELVPGDRNVVANLRNVRELVRRRRESQSAP